MIFTVKVAAKPRPPKYQRARKVERCARATIAILCILGIAVTGLLAFGFVRIVVQGAKIKFQAMSHSVTVRPKQRPDEAAELDLLVP